MGRNFVFEGSLAFFVFQAELGTKNIHLTGSIDISYSGSRCSLYVSTFKGEHMTVLDRKRLVETGVWVEHKFETYGRSTVEKYKSSVEYGQSIPRHSRKIPRARSKPLQHTSLVQHGRIISCLGRARFFRSSTVETYEI